MKKGNSLAKAQVVAFHEQYNNQDFDAMIDDAHPDMLKASPKDELTDLYSTVREKLGKVVDSKTVGWNINTINLKTTITLTQDTTFEEGKGQEIFTFRIQDEKARLLGYNINSNDLIMK